MKKIVFLLALIIPNLAFANTYIEKKVDGYTFKVIQYELNSQDYEIKVVKTDNSTNLSDLLKQNNAITWVNGVFFCPTDYSWCNTSKSFTDNERYIEWEKFATYLTTWDRAVFAWDVNKVPFIYQSGKINMDWEAEIYYGLGNYPLLLSEWKNMLEEYWEKWLIDGKMKAKGTRNFICSDEKKENIYFGLVYDATLEEATSALRSFGCYDALNLDAGLSTVFMYNNRYLVGPQKRDILDAVAIERKGLDLKEITQIGENITKVLVWDIEKRSKNSLEKTDTYITSYMSALEALRKKAYEKYTEDLYELNFVWELERVWYTIKSPTLKHLKLITLVNEVHENLKKLRLEVREKIKQQETLEIIK